MSNVWDEWGRITRFLEGARIAFAREANLWTTLQIDHDVTVSVAVGKGVYTVDREAHVRAMEDEEALHASVLIHSYALAEFAACSKLSLGTRYSGGIEDWGTRLLATEGHEWSDVKGDLGGAVQLAVVRNAFAHGTRQLDDLAEKRLAKAGVSNRRAGEIVTLSYEELKEHRWNLRSLLRQGGFGTVTDTKTALSLSR